MEECANGDYDASVKFIGLHATQSKERSQWARQPPRNVHGNLLLVTAEPVDADQNVETKINEKTLVLKFR